MTKIDVFSGFLGAGKTTLIKRLINAYKGEKVVLIENEFGEIGVDSGFLKDAGFEIKEINSGCICCTLVGDFTKALGEVINEYHPDRVIIEPSGVGKLSDIKHIIEKAGLVPNMLVTVVDASKGKLYMRNFGEFFNDQVKEATTILISKVDRTPESKVLELADLLREKNPNANIITTPVAELEIKKLIEIFENDKSMLSKLIDELSKEHEEDDDHDEHECHHHHHEDGEECHCHEHHHEHHHEDGEECHCHEHHHEEGEECHCHEHHHDHHADEIFDNWGIETAQAVSRGELEIFLDKLANDDTLGIILRAKGILRANDETSWYYFDLVDDTYEIRLGKPDYTGRLCVIGANIDKNKISNMFLKK